MGAFFNDFGLQVENTRYQGSSISSGSSGSYGSSGSSGSYGSSSGSYGHSSGSSEQSSSSSGAASSSSTLDSNDVVETNGGKWVWSEVSQKWEWEAEAGAKQVHSPHLWHFVSLTIAILPLSILCPLRLRQLSRTLAHQTQGGQCCPMAHGLARPPPGLPTPSLAQEVASWEVSALGSFCQAEENRAIMEATTLDGSPNQMEPW